MNDSALQIYDRMENPLDAITRMGDFFSKSGMFGCTKSEQGMVLAMACMFEKKSPLDIKRTYHLIDGELSKRSDAMLAEFNSIGGEHDIISQTPDEAAVKLTLKGKSHVFRLTWVEAQAEPFVNDSKGGIKKNYRTPRARMQTMWARVISQGVRTMAPGVVAGTYTPEEIEDFGTDNKPKQDILKKPETEVVSTPPPPAAKQAKSEAPIIDVVAEPHKPSPVSAPVKTPAPELAKTAQAPSPAAGKRLSNETMTALQNAIGEKHWDAAEKHLTAKGLMTDGWYTLAPDWAKNIIKDPAGFLTKSMRLTL